MHLRKILALAFAVITPLAARAQNISTVAGGGPINLDPTASSVGAPVAVRQDSIGNTYILDNSTNRIYKIAATGQPNAGKLTVFAGNGKDGYNGNGGLAVNAEFSGPVGMCIDAHDNVWVADSDNGLMRKILMSLTGANPGEQLGHIYDIVGIQTPTNFLFGGDGGPMASAHLHFPDGCGFDTRGNLYIADRGNNAIRIAITGTPFGTFAAGNIYSFVSAGDGDNVLNTPPSPGVAADGTTAASAALNGPYDVFVDANNNVFIGLVGNPAPDPPAIPPPTANLVRVIWAADHGAQLAGKIYTLAGAVSGGNTTGAVVAATSAALTAAQGISVDSNGNLIFGDPGNNVVREVPGSVAPPAGMTPGNIYIIAGNFGLRGYAGDGNLATDPAVRLANPVGTFLKANGDLLIADSSGTSVRLVDHTTAIISTLGGNGHLSFGGDGGPAIDAQINAPAGLATFSTFDLVIADFNNKLLRGVKASDSSILTITGQPEFEGYFGNGIPATGATIQNNAVINTNGVWLDAAGNGYLADTDNCVVRKIDTGGIITTIAGTVPVVPDPVNAPFFSVPQCGLAGLGGPALSAKLGKITGVAADSVGNVYFADSTNNVIWVLWKTTTTSPARTGGNVYVVSTGTTLSSPTGVFVDSYDNVYFADTNRHVVRQISAATGAFTVVAGTDGSAGFSPDGTAATSAQLQNPSAVFVDGAGNVFISDTGNNVIREVPFADGGGKTKGDIYTVVGTGTAGFNGDGILATAAQINAPQGMAKGPTNSLYFSDSANNRVRSVANLTSNPSLTVSKLLLSFGNQAVLIPSAALTITVKNTGAATITLNAPQITGTNPADFAFTNHCGATLTAGATCTIDVTFTPSTTAAKSATLTVSDTVPESRAVSLTGTGVVGIPGVLLAPTTLPAFALQAVGTTSATGQDVTVTNNGTAAVNFTGANPFTFTGANLGDFTQTSTCGATLAVAANCKITVKFAPTAAGSRSASLNIADNVSGSPQLVPVSGTAAVPTVNLSGTTVTFADQTVNTTSAAKTVTVTNNGTVPLTITTIAKAGTNAADFTVSDDCPKTPSTLAVSGTCTVTATFTPAATGARTATVTITDNASPTTQTVTLNGNGLAAGPTVTLTPATLPQFADQVIGASSTTQALTLTNTSTVAFTVPSPITIGGLNPGDFQQTNDCGASLAGGAVCHINVKFAPTAGPAGLRSAFISIMGQTSNFSGVGVVIALGGSSTSQTVKAGATATYTLQLTATGGAPTDTFSVTFACSGAPSKATCTVPTSAVTVTPAAPTAVTVTVSTTAASTLVPFSEPSVQGPATMRFLPLTIVSLLLFIAMMLAWMQSPAGRMRAVRFAVTACLVLMPIAMGAMLTGCASSNGSGSTPPPTPVPGTPAGTYTVAVTPTVGGVTQPPTNLTLIVQ